MQENEFLKLIQTISYIINAEAQLEHSCRLGSHIHKIQLDYNKIAGFIT